MDDSKENMPVDIRALRVKDGANPFDLIVQSIN